MREVKRLVHKSEKSESKCCSANCSVTPTLMVEIEMLQDLLGYKSRSEFIYQAILNFIEVHRKINL